MSDERLLVALYVDADLTTRIVPALRQRGYECRSAVEDGFDNALDEAILAQATELGMVLLTNNDRDFSPIARRWTEGGRDHAGIMLRQQTLTASARCRV